MSITLRQMRAFSVVARTASFTIAARQLNLTQSAVSMLVQQLEDTMGLKLFDRTRNAITLTEAGRQLLPLARRMLDDLRQIEEGASDLRTLRSGMLRVVAPQLMACTWVAGVLGRFEQAHPTVGLRLVDATADDIVGTVRRGDAELGIGPERPTGDDVTRSFLMNVPMRLVCAASHPLAERQTVSWHELRDERWVVYSGDFSRYVEQRLHEHDTSLSMQTATEVSYLTTALALVGTGMGVATVPDYARGFAGNFGIRFIALRAPALNREFFVYQRRGLALSPAAEAFAQMLRRAGTRRGAAAQAA
ncbi:LysR family transcriptional regulator [Variovorax sp. Sphag1AA]|uniref:LysR family transcriptional regulator n=1 Tax=Variovorax sp. Sphag1AA TaxID=2587027 RepID=UPI0016096131|nr:LysR family transcriptional regulator [Variovorax sp. Sphag1AA]MBB3178253.1 DNA-binding transcriptional LysR family regulator [Variovorax sp. Sphag1AA]